MTVHDLINRDIQCSCGRTHRCDIETLKIGAGAIGCLAEAVALKNYSHILLVADSNTYPLCADRVKAILGERLEGVCLFETDDFLVPDEESIKAIEERLSKKTDLILGIGSGVINDLCKYVSFFHGIKSGINATATSMDGYASSGAAMIIGGMKITYNTHAPSIIIGDTDILKDAPMEMIRAGYGDIIGKYSALCDWKLSALVNGEYICPFVYDIVKDKTDEIRSLAQKIVSRDPDAIGKLMETLVLIGACLTLLSTTRPGSGSEHHLSHFFEITGLIEGKPYLLHGTDVAHATVVTAGLREKIVKLSAPEFHHISDGDRERCYKKIYHGYWSEVSKIQNEAGRYQKQKDDVYTAHWDEVRSILAECPSAREIQDMLTEVGFDLNEFEAAYGSEKIKNSVWFGKDLKDRYSVLWLWCDLFLSNEEARKIYEN